jgi:hypothetical protein
MNKLHCHGAAVRIWYSVDLSPQAKYTDGGKDLVNLKNLLTSSGLEPTTFQLVVQCLNHLHYHVPPSSRDNRGNLCRILK